jgi:hypothetical protein
MVLLYAPAFAVGAWFALSAAAAGDVTAAAGNGRELACGSMVALHFFKRLVEVSARMGRRVAPVTEGLGSWFSFWSAPCYTHVFLFTPRRRWIPAPSLQVACVHVYSGRMDRATAFGIGTYYALMSWMVLHQQVGSSSVRLLSK